MQYLVCLASLILVISQNLGQALALRGCQNYVTNWGGTVYELTEHARTPATGGTYSIYERIDGPDAPATLFCYYDASLNRIGGGGSACPPSLSYTPYAGKFLIQFHSSDHCATILGEPKDGAKVAIKACDKKHDYPGQAWTIDGQNIRQGDLCLDVKGGNTNNGTPLQVWTCTSFSGNNNGDGNRKFDLDSGNVVLYGDGHQERFIWSGKNKCVHLPSGDTKDGNQLETWDCNPSNNPKQRWKLQVVNPRNAIGDQITLGSSYLLGTFI
ncbi:ricin B lectin domain-containing protein [Flagelloscypha sp. PMI_526]|nr:ricin B lectin domain-containing protein [Flagelloscypha sp. PMI_526]